MMFNFSNTTTMNNNFTPRTGLKVGLAALLLALLLSWSGLALAEEGDNANNSNMSAPPEVVFDGLYAVNLENITLQEFTLFVQDVTDVNYVYNPADLTATVTIKSRGRMSREDIIEIYQSTLAANGLATINRGNYVLISKTSKLKEIDDPVVNSRMAAANREDLSYLTTAVIQVNNYSSSQLASYLRNFRSNFGFITSIDATNSLLIREDQSTLNKMMDIIRQIDSVSKRYKLRSIDVKKTSATKLANTLRSFFNELNKKGLQGGVPLFLASDETNTLIVAGTSADFDRIDYFMEQISDTIEGGSAGFTSRVFKLQNSKASEMHKIVNTIVGAQKAKPGEIPNRVSFDSTTNSIIAVGSSEFYSRIEDVINKLDIPRKQIYMEMLILETSITKSSQIGVEWTSFAADSAGNTLGFLGNVNQQGSLLGLQNAIVNGAAPASIPAGLSLGVLGNTISFNGISFPSISAMLTAVSGDSGFEIISKPQILTLDNEPAEVFVGENRPFSTGTTVDTNGVAQPSIDYRNVGVSLKVTPHISGDDSIILALEQTVDEVSSSSASLTTPVTLTRRTKTTVKLQDDSIMLISGLMQNRNSTSDSGIPFMRSIPFVGKLFGAERRDSSKLNMMVFLSARIVNNPDDMIDIVDNKTSASLDFTDYVYKKVYGMDRAKSVARGGLDGVGNMPSNLQEIRESYSLPDIVNGR